MRLKKGELIMHETAGVCRVNGETELDGLEGIYYILNPLYMKDATFYTPRDNGKVKIRPVMSREAALSLIDALPSVDPVKFANFSEQKQRSNEILKSGDSLQLASLTKALHYEQVRRAKLGKKSSLNDSTLLKKAELLLFGELATALDIEMDQVEAFISEKLDAQ